MGESWYLACDFQLFLLGPWIMILIWKVKRFAKFIMAALLVISCTIPGLLTGLNHWPPQNFSTILFGDWMSGFYTQFYTRSTPYIWGIIFGCIVFNQKSSAREIEKSFMQKVNNKRNNAFKNSRNLLSLLDSHCYCLVNLHYCRSDNSFRSCFLLAC